MPSGPGRFWGWERNGIRELLLHDGGFPLAMMDIGSSQSGTEVVSTCTPLGKIFGKRYVGSRKRRDRIEGGLVPPTSVKPYSFANSATTCTWCLVVVDMITTKKVQA